MMRLAGRFRQPHRARLRHARRTAWPVERERDRPALDVTHHLQQRLARPARRRPARGAVAEPGDDARDPFAVEVLAGDDDDAATLEVDRAGQDAAVPERVNRMAERLGGLQMFEPVDAVPVGRAERREQRVAEAADGGELRALRGGGAPGGAFHEVTSSSYEFKAPETGRTPLNWELVTGNCTAYIPSYCGPPPPSGGTQVITPYGSMMSQVLQWTQFDALICSRRAPPPSSTIS